MTSETPEVCGYCGTAISIMGCICNVFMLRDSVDRLRSQLAAKEAELGVMRDTWYSPEHMAAVEQRTIQPLRTALEKERAIVKGVHGAIVDAGDIPVPGMDADLYATIMKIVDQRNQERAKVARLREAIKEIRGISCGEDNVPNVDVYRETDTDALAWVFHRAEESLASLDIQSERDARVLRAAEELSDVAKRRNDDCLTGALITPEIDAIHKILKAVRGEKA